MARNGASRSTKEYPDLQCPPGSPSIKEAEDLLFPPGSPVLRLRIGKVLVAGTVRGSPCRIWKVWEKPEKVVNIDLQIQKLIERSKDKTLHAKKPRMRSREELEKLKVACPYYTARFFTLHAVKKAAAAVDLVAHNRNVTAPRLQAMADRADILARELRSFTEEFHNIELSPSPGPYSERMDYSAINAVLGSTADAFIIAERAVLSMELISQLARTRKEKIAPDNRHGHVWQIAFAAELGFLWRLLTGAKPAAGEGSNFVTFVEQAFACFSEIELKWQRPIRTAVERVNTRPEWDRFDRIEKGTDPPGTGYRSIDTWIAPDAPARLSAEQAAIKDLQSELETRAFLAGLGCRKKGA